MRDRHCADLQLPLHQLGGGLGHNPDCILHDGIGRPSPLATPKLGDEMQRLRERAYSVVSAVEDDPEIRRLRDRAYSIVSRGEVQVQRAGGDRDAHASRGVITDAVDDDDDEIWDTGAASLVSSRGLHEGLRQGSNM